MSEYTDNILARLSPEEQEAVRKILGEYTDDGKSSTLKNLYDTDFYEVPVSIDEFIERDEYAGWFTGNGANIFPYWREKLREIFDEKNNFSEIVLGGCLTGDTVIPLLNGKKKTMEELAEIGDLDEYVYSFDTKRDEYTVGHLTQAFCTGIKKVYRITLDNGECIKATSNHKFLSRDKHWVSIDNGLKTGTSLMPLNKGELHYRNIPEPYETIFHPKKNGTYVEETTHKMVMRYKLGTYEGVVHHKDRDKKNNDPRNLVRATFKNHFNYHVKTLKQYMATEKGKSVAIKNIAKFNRDYKNGNVSEDTLKRLHDGQIKGCISRWNDPEQHTRIAEITRNRMINGLAKEMCKARNKKPEILAKYSKTMSERNKDKEYANRQWIAKAVKIASIALVKYGELTEETYQRAKFENGMRSGYPSYKSTLKRISEYELLDLARNYNHKVVSIEYIGEELVYDLTVDEHHNFVTESGIVAHNSIGCGKSTIAVIGLAYTLYWLMCLKDPNPYFGLGRGDTIFIVFFNATLQLSRGVAYNKFQSLLQHSPWFMARGSVSGTKHLEYIPNKTDNADIKFTVGSQPEHSLGKAILAGILDEVNFCLYPQTKVLTDKGVKTLYELQNQSFKVFYLDDNGNIALSDEVVSDVTDLVSEMYEIELEDGTVIQCSATHLFMLEDGTYKQAMDLTEEDNIKSFGKEELS